MNTSVDIADLLRYLSGKSSESEVLRVLAWCDANTANAELLNTLRHAGDVGPARFSIDVAHAMERLHDQLDAVTVSTSAPPIMHTATPHAVRQTFDMFRKPTRHPLRGWFALIGVTLGGIALSIGWRVEWSQHLRSTSILAAAPATVYATGPGEVRAFRLADGSTVALGEASRLEVPQNFRVGDHPLRLRGAAAFTVRHQAGGTFTVAVPGAMVRVLGTTFAISRYATATTTLVAVHDGKVAVRANGMKTAVLTDRKTMVIEQGTMRVASIDERQSNLKGGVMNPIMMLYSLTALVGATPTVPVDTAKRVGDDSILTVDVLTKMKNFWKIENSQCKQDKDPKNGYERINHRMLFSIKMDLPIGQKRGSVERISAAKMVEAAPMDAGQGLMRVASTSVAASLKEAGLSPEKYDFYQMLIASAEATAFHFGLGQAPAVDYAPTTTEQKNIDFLKAHERENLVWQRMMKGVTEEEANKEADGKGVK